MKKILLFLPLLILFLSCQDEDSVTNPDDSNTLQDKITFSGLTWDVRITTGYQGPGSNMFSSRKKNVWVDGAGKLHLKITKEDDNTWRAAEISSEKSFDYGRYIFYVESSNIAELDENVVLGLFTWDNNSFQTMANTEIDIEFARWGVTSIINTLQYSVQPTNAGEYPERYHSLTSKVMPSEGTSTHLFQWTSSAVTFESYKTYNMDESNRIDSWIFTGNNPPRQAEQGGVKSQAIVVPVPTPDTKVHINLWLFDKNGDGIGDPPTDMKEVEVVIGKFEFVGE
jgi:hypothetical protein